jgi:hypothetical protein
LHEIHSSVAIGKTLFSYNQNRKEQIVLWPDIVLVIVDLHSYLLNNEERLECILCNSNYSLKHILIDSIDVADTFCIRQDVADAVCIRQTFYNVNIYLISLQISHMTQFLN